MAKKKKKKYRFFWEEPLEELERTRREFEEAIKSFWSEPFRFEFTIPRITFPRFPHMQGKVKQTDKEVIVQIPLPGFKKDEIDLRVTENAIYVKAQKKHIEKEKSEFAFFASAEESKVENTYRLPTEIIPEKVRAKLEDGILTIIAPKAKPERKERKVKIE